MPSPTLHNDSYFVLFCFFVSQQGCMMTSVSMALAGADVDLSNTTKVNPLTLNSWLLDHDGYGEKSIVIGSVLTKINPDRISYNEATDVHLVNDLKYSEISSFLLNGKVVIANVNYGEHFVLVTGFTNDGDTLIVNDPGFERSTYSHLQDVVGYRLLDVTRKSEPNKESKRTVLTLPTTRCT